MTRIQRCLLAALPVSIVETLSWFGTFTFINAYVVGKLAYSDVDWTGLTLWFTGGIIIWQLVMTRVSAGIGRRPVVMSGMLLSSLCFAAIGYTENAIALRGLMFCLGLMHVSFIGVWLPMVAEEGGARPGRALALNQLAFTGISVPALVLGGRLITWLDHDLTFLLCAVLSFLCLAAFYLITRPFGAGKSVDAVDLLSMKRTDLAALTAGPFIWILLAGVCMEPFGFHTANHLFPNLARKEFGFSEQAIIAVVASVRLSGLISLYGLASRIDHGTPPRYYGLGLAAAGSAVVLMGLSGSGLFLVIGYVLFYLGQGMVWGANSASVNAGVDPRLRDSAFALMNIFMMVAVFGTGIVHNRLLTAGLSLRMLFVLCGVLAVCGGITLSSRFRRGIRLPQSTDSPGSTCGGGFEVAEAANGKTFR